MEDFEEKLNAILASPEAMGQIMSLANSLSGQTGEAQAEQNAQTGQAAPAGQVTPVAPAAPVAPAGQAGQVAPVAPAGQAGPAAPVAQASPLALLQNLDPALLGTATRLFQAYQRQDDDKAALLRALRPFLRQERQARLERAIQLTRLSRVLRTALGLFREAGHV